MKTNFDDVVKTIINYFDEHGQDSTFNSGVEKITNKGKIGLDLMDSIVYDLAPKGLYLPREIALKLYPTTFARYYMTGSNINQLIEDDIYFVTRTNNPQFILKFSRIVKEKQNIQLLENIVMNWGDVSIIMKLIANNKLVNQILLRDSLRDKSDVKFFDENAPTKEDVEEFTESTKTTESVLENI